VLDIERFIGTDIPFLELAYSIGEGTAAILFRSGS